jgi:hypothetical protein
VRPSPQYVLCVAACWAGGAGACTYRVLAGAGCTMTVLAGAGVVGAGVAVPDVLALGEAAEEGEAAGVPLQ